MADDREILKEVWDGKLPITFTLAREDITTPETPEDLRVCLNFLTFSYSY